MPSIRNNHDSWRLREHSNPQFPAMKQRAQQRRARAARGEDMKIRKMLATMAVAGALFVCADAQAADVVIKKVEVPFDFTVRGYAMPAGTYTIFRTDPAQDLFILRNVQTRDNVV